MFESNFLSKLFCVFCLIWISSVLGCGNSAKQNEAFAASIQGKWVGEPFNLVIGKNHVEMSSSGKRTESFRYKLFSSEKRIEITNPENGRVLKGIFTDQDTLEFEHLQKPGKILVLHRMDE